MLLKYVFAAVLLVQACSALKPRITDGENAQPGQFPYQASIEWGVRPLIKFRHVCGGSILNERYILTAGHCVLKVGKLRAVVGKHYLMKHESFEQISEVSKAIVHSGYPGGVAPYDIALLKLKTPLVFNERVSPVQLPTQDKVFEGLTTLTGWGSVSKTLRPKLPNELQVGYVSLLDNQKCYEVIESVVSPTGKKPELYDSQVCTVAATTSACSGDSGGPLVQFVNGEPVQVGIVSWGFMPCGSDGMPSVFTRVASYVDWLHSQMI